jgi:hypothetical protein
MRRASGVSVPSRSQSIAIAILALASESVLSGSTIRANRPIPLGPILLGPWIKRLRFADESDGGFSPDVN